MSHNEGHWCKDLTCSKCYCADTHIKYDFEMLKLELTKMALDNKDLATRCKEQQKALSELRARLAGIAGMAQEEKP